MERGQSPRRILFAILSQFGYIDLMLKTLREDGPQHVYNLETNGILINVFPTFVPERSAPENDYFFFAYKVTITNLSGVGLKLINRHWIIKDGHKKERFINGEGVVGQRPLIEAGDEFEYQSFCPLDTPTGNMRGKFEFTDEEDNRFWAPVPLFFFRTPESFAH
jgi:ApaG protein